MNYSKPIRGTLVVVFAVGIGLASLAQEATAAGRFERGRTLYHRKCASCFTLGWKWAPRRLAPAERKRLLERPGAVPAQKVCTLMRRASRQIKGPGCYPRPLSARDKRDILYYVVRRSEGKIRAPRLRRLRAKVLRNFRFKKTTAARYRAALQHQRELRELRRLRAKRAVPRRVRHRAAKRGGR